MNQEEKGPFTENEMKPFVLGDKVLTNRESALEHLNFLDKSGLLETADVSEHVLALDPSDKYNAVRIYINYESSTPSKIHKDPKELKSQKVVYKSGMTIELIEE